MMCDKVKLSRDLIAQVDRIVGQEGRDQFVAEAVQEQLRRRRRAAFEKFAGSLRDANIPGWETSEAAAEWVHDLRYHPEKLVTVPAESGDPGDG